MTKIMEWLRLHLVASLVGSGLLGGVGGALLTDFASFRDNNREILKSQSEASSKADQELIDIIRKFSNRALGKATTTPEDLKTLQASVTRAFVATSALSEHVPSAKADVESYTNALISVQKSAEKLNGPADAQPFVQAVSDFGDKRQKLQTSIAKYQTSWLFK